MRSLWLSLFIFWAAPAVLKSQPPRANDGWPDGYLIAENFTSPDARFAVLKKQQIAWIETLEAAGTDAKKIKLIAGRVGELQKLAWEP